MSVPLFLNYFKSRKVKSIFINTGLPQLIASVDQESYESQYKYNNPVGTDVN